MLYNVTNRVFLKDPGSAACVCGALYVPIDDIKEIKDKSVVKRRVQGREGERKGCLMSLTSYEGLFSALIGSPRIHLAFLSD